MHKVIQLQNSTKSAGSAAYRLHKALRERNVDAGIVSLYDELGGDEKIRYLRMRARTKAWMDDVLQSRLIRSDHERFGRFSYPILGNNVSRMEEIRQADVIYLHWVQGGFLNLANFEQLARLGKPIVIVLHDMWAITGGCHYSFSCEKYTSGCHSCQMFPNRKKKDWSYRAFNKKMKLYAKYDNLHFVSPSKWLYELARKSLLTKTKPIHHIPNVIDNTFFRPVNKDTARQMLNIDPAETVVAFGAFAISSPYKGWKYLRRALEVFHEESPGTPLTVLIFGAGYDQQIDQALPFKTHFLGYLADEYSMILVYNASDVFVVPSLADNLPTTVLESLCCGTPVVGFHTGGIPDMISHQSNGYLARYQDAEDIATGIRFCIDHKIKGRLLSAFEKNRVVQEHLDLIHHIAKR